MSEPEKKDDLQPVFDFSDYSYGDTQAEFNYRLERQRVAQKLDLGAFIDRDEFDQLQTEYQQWDRKIDGELCKYLADVPRSWLVKRAPDKIDWSKAESLKWIRADRINALRKAAVDARNPESVSGNSARR